MTWTYFKIILQLAYIADINNRLENLEIMIVAYQT